MTGLYCCKVSARAHVINWFLKGSNIINVELKQHLIMRRIYARYPANGRSVLETARNYTQQACMHFKYGSKLVQSVQHPQDDVRKPFRSHFNRNKSFFS